MRSRNSAFSTRSAAQVGFRIALHRGDLALQLAALLDRGGELRFELADVGAELVHGAAAAPAGILELFAQIALGPARGLELAAQPLDLEFALGQEPALIAEPRFQLLHAAAQDLGFGRLHEQLPLAARRRAPPVRRACRAPRRQLGRRLRFAAFARQPLFGRPHRALVVGDADLHRFDLRAQRRQLDALTVGHDRALAELGDELGKLGLLVGERALRLAQRGRISARTPPRWRAVDRAEFLSRDSEREDRRGLLAELFLELVDGVGLLAELGELAGGLGLHLLDAHFEPARRHGEFGAQLILVGADFGDRQRRRRFEAPHRQAHGAVMHQGDEKQSEQRRNQKPDPEIHDRFDHDTTLYALTAARRHIATRQTGSTIFTKG